MTQQYSTELKIISGTQQQVQDELNLLSNLDWMVYGSIVVVPVKDGFHYSVLMSKTTEKK